MPFMIGGGFTQPLVTGGGGGPTAWQATANFKGAGLVVPSGTINSGSGFSPSDLSPIAWYKADTGVSMSGSLVTSWSDQSGNGYTLSTNNGEMYRNLTGFNGLPMLWTDWHSGMFSTGAFNVNMGTASPGPRSFFAVCMTGTFIPDSASIMSMIGTAGHNSWDAGAGDLLCAREGGQPWLNMYNNTSDTFSYLTPMRLGFTSNGTNWVLWLNGVSRADGLTTAKANSATCLLVVGGSISGGSIAAPPWCGALSEVVLFNTELTTQQVADLNSYFMSKWGF